MAKNKFEAFSRSELYDIIKKNGIGKQIMVISMVDIQDEKKSYSTAENIPVQKSWLLESLSFKYGFYSSLDKDSREENIKNNRRIRVEISGNIMFIGV